MFIVYSIYSFIVYSCVCSDHLKPVGLQYHYFKLFSRLIFKVFYKKQKSLVKQDFSERETGLEPATPTLARSYSTNWATRAYVYYINIPIICKGNTMNLLRKFKYAIFLSSYFATLVLTKKGYCSTMTLLRKIKCTYFLNSNSLRSFSLRK